MIVLCREQRASAIKIRNPPFIPLWQREAVKKLVLPNPTPKISPDPSFSKEGNSCSKQTWGRILNTKDCVSISGYSPFGKGGKEGDLKARVN